MSKLHPGHIDPTQENISKFLSTYGIHVDTYSPINQGMENSSFKIESNGRYYVLRVYRSGKKTDEEISFELSFQDTLRQAGIPIPEAYRTTEGKVFTTIEIKGNVWQGILMEFVEGNSTVKTYSSQLMRELAQYQATMHFIGLSLAESNIVRPVVKWNSLRDSFAKRVTDLAAYENEMRGFIERVRSYEYPLNSELSYGYNHLDLDLDGNVITKNDHIVAILDFDDLAYSPVVVCLGFTCWEILFTDGPDAVTQYLVEYEKHRSLSDIERETLPHAILHRNYVVGMIELLQDKKPKSFDRILKLEGEIPNLSYGQTI